MTPDIIHHLEAHLGTIAAGWGDRGSIQVVRFPGQPQPGVDTYCTIGLSGLVLRMRTGRTVRQELLVSVHASYPAEKVASFLLSFAEYVGSHGRALLRGDVVGPSEPLIPGIRARAVYAAMPVFFDDEFATFRGSEPATVFVWLIPLPADDAKFVRASGWDAFEEHLERADVDLWSLDRPGLLEQQ